jgi:hypothetical protein
MPQSETTRVANDNPLTLTDLSKITGIEEDTLLERLADIVLRREDPKPRKIVAAPRRWFKTDKVHWALYCLSRDDVHEAVDSPLVGTPELLANGWAKIHRRYEDDPYKYHVLRITESGRAELKKAFENDI